MENTAATALAENKSNLEMEREDSERTYHTLVGAVAAGIAGWVIGVGQLWVIGSWRLVYWPYVAMIPLYSALGWALFGMIVGGSGILGKSKRHGSEAHEARHAA